MRLSAHTIGAIRTVVAPNGFDLTVQSDADLDGSGTAAAVSYHLPAGTTVALAHIPTHHNQARWGQHPERYDPSRAEWSAESRPDDYKFTTFSQGLHKCPGERLALSMMQCALAQLLCGGYETELTVAAVPPIDFQRPTLAQRAGPVAVRIRARVAVGER